MIDRNEAISWMVLILVAALMLLCVAGSLVIGGEHSARFIRVTATAYCPCHICTDGDGITATGRDAHKAGIAVDPRIIGLGSHVDVPGIGAWLRADDTGSAITGHRIDIRMQSHSEAKRYGRKTITIRVWSL